MSAFLHFDIRSGGKPGKESRGVHVGAAKRIDYLPQARNQKPNFEALRQDAGSPARLAKILS